MRSLPATPPSNGVIVTVSNAPADVYVPVLNNANYSGFSGGNGSTNGRFELEGTGGSVSGSNTHIGVAPPAFGPPGGP